MKAILIAVVVGLVLAGAVAPTASAESSDGTEPVGPPPQCYMTLKTYADLGIILIRGPDEVYCEF